jgi:hypothetical protein
MKSNLERNSTAGPPGPPPFGWWAERMAQTYQLATFASLYPGLATMRYMRLFFKDMERAEPPSGPPEKAPAQVGEKPPSDLEELRRAWQEFEERKGDWSKGR